jgi:hypothetical protein
MIDAMTNFTTYADRARRDGHLDLAKRIETEGRICSFLVKHALAAGYTVSVHDGEEWSVIRSTKYTEIMEELFTTDSNSLLIRDKDGKRLGSIELIYGNDGYDVMGDWSAPNDEALEALSEWLKPVTEYADKFEPA